MTLRKKWPLLLGISLFGLILSYFLCLKICGTYGFKVLTIVYGALGLLLLVILVVYNIRKKIYSRQIGSTQSWLLAHIYLGVFAIFIVIAHSNFRLSGTFSIIVFSLFTVVVSSGIVGLLIYRNVPLALSKFGRDVFTEDEIRCKIKELQTEAEKSIAAMSIESRNFYEKKIKPQFVSKRTKWEYLVMEESAVINKQNIMFKEHMNNAPDNEVYAIRLLIDPVIEKEKLKFMLVKLRLLKSWLNIHVPLTGALLTSVIIHTLSTFYF